MSKGNKGKKVNKSAKVTKAGAVEVNEDQLDEAAGGAAVDYFRTIETSDPLAAPVKTGYDLQVNKKI